MARLETTPGAGRPRSAPRSGRSICARLLRDPMGGAALVLLVLIGIATLLAPFLPLPSPVAMDLPRAYAPPQVGWSARQFRPEFWPLTAIDRSLLSARAAVFGKRQLAPWLGTDAKGRDLLARLVWGGRTSLAVALLAAAVSAVLGVGVGALAGLAGGWLDALLMRFVDAMYGVPFTFLVIFLIALLDGLRDLPGGELLDRETVFFLVIGAVFWLTMARVVRGQVLVLRRAEYIQVAELMGASRWWIIRRHLIPNLAPIVIVTLTLTIPSVVLCEAFLSFLGLGVAPPRVSWGILAAEGTEAISPIHSRWWLVVGPALAMGTTLLALHLLGDALRDALARGSEHLPGRARGRPGAK